MLTLGALGLTAFMTSDLRWVEAAGPLPSEVGWVWSTLDTGGGFGAASTSCVGWGLASLGWDALGVFIGPRPWNPSGWGAGSVRGDVRTPAPPYAGGGI